MNKVLIMDADEAFAEQEKTYLELSGIESEVFASFQDFSKAAYNDNPSLLIMDPGSSGSEGYMFLRHLRESSNIPVIITSPYQSESDRILGFELGCDDYLVKPFSLKEMVLRIKAMMRRKAPVEASSMMSFSLGS